MLVITGVPERPNGSPFFSKKKITLFFANWKDLMKIYEEESEGMLKSKARLSFAVLYPKSFEKQKISQALKIFHEKKYKHKVVRHSKTETARF